jgi:hypothetical protein
MCRDCLYFNYEKSCCTHPKNIIDYEVMEKEVEPWSGMPPGEIYKQPQSELNTNNDCKWYTNPEREIFPDLSRPGFSDKERKKFLRMR